MKIDRGIARSLSEGGGCDVEITIPCWDSSKPSCVYAFMSKKMSTCNGGDTSPFRKIIKRKILPQRFGSNGGIIRLDENTGKIRNKVTICTKGGRRRNKFSIYRYTFRKMATRYYDGDMRKWRFEWL